MIREFANKETAALFDGRRAKHLPQNIQQRARERLKAIHAAENSPGSSSTCCLIARMKKAGSPIMPRVNRRQSFFYRFIQRLNQLP